MNDPGGQAPDYTLPGLDGQRHSLREAHDRAANRARPAGKLTTADADIVPWRDDNPRIQRVHDGRAGRRDSPFNHLLTAREAERLTRQAFMTDNPRTIVMVRRDVVPAGGAAP